jgi:hypothetical protein
MKTPLIRILMCAAATFLIYRMSGQVKELAAVRFPFTVVAAGAVWAFALGPYVLDLVAGIRDRARSDVLEPWNGRYYAFDNHQIRLFLIDGVIWVPARDVATLLTPQPGAREHRILGADYGPIPGQKLFGYTEAGLLRVLATRTKTRMAAHDLLRFNNWLQREAFPNLRRLPGSASP